MHKANKWDLRFIELAELVSTWSRDPSTKVGAVITREDKSIVSVGYNGLPRGIQDSPERLHNRPVRLAMTTHAELNAILSARQSVASCALYVAPFHPCSQCATAIIQAGITSVYYRMQECPERWVENFSLAQDMLREAGIKVQKI